MNVFDNDLYIGTNKSFYIHNKRAADLGGNSQFLTDIISENSYSPTGTIRQNATIVNHNRLYFLGEYQINSEFSAYQLSGNGSTKASAIYNKFSESIDKYLYKADFKDSCMGILQDKTIISFLDESGQRIVIVASEYTQSSPTGSQSANWSYYTLDFIEPKQFFNEKKALYFIQHNDGKLYKFQNVEYGKSINVPDQGIDTITEFPTGIWNSVWTGYDKSKTSSLSKKQLDKIVIKGYFAKGTELEIDFFLRDPNDTKSIIITFDEDDQQLQNESILEGIEDINYRNNSPYYTRCIIFSGDQNISYTSFSYRLNITNSRYYFIEHILFEASEISQDGVMVEEAKFV
jgi:hypothetical protein